MRTFSVLAGAEVSLRAPELREVETEGDLPVIEVAMRDVRPDALPTPEFLSELAAGCLAPVGVEGLAAPIESPMRNPDVPRLELERLLDRAAGCLASVETDGLSIRIELLTPD